MSDFAYPLHEECGVFGIYDRAGTEDVAAAAYSALYALQHRGKESCGIAVNDDGVINGHRDLGLDRKSTRLNSSHSTSSRMPSSA